MNNRFFKTVLLAGLLSLASTTAQASSITFDFTGSSNFLGFQETFTSGGTSILASGLVSSNADFSTSLPNVIRGTSSGIGAGLLNSNLNSSAGFFGFGSFSEAIRFAIPAGFTVDGFQLSGLSSTESASTSSGNGFFQIAALSSAPSAFRIRSLTISQLASTPLPGALVLFLVGLAAVGRKIRIGRKEADLAPA